MEIESIQPEPASEAVKIAFDGPVLVKTGGDPRKTVSLGRATFWGSGVEEKEPGIRTVAGSLLVTSKGGFHKLTIPYVATVVSGFATLLLLSSLGGSGGGWIEGG